MALPNGYELFDEVPSAAEYRRCARSPGSRRSPRRRRPRTGTILARLLERLRADGPAGAYVSLFADPPGRELYHRHGFRETAPDQVGMAIVLGGQPPAR